MKKQIYYKLWWLWHGTSRRFFDRFAPMCSTCTSELQTLKELAAEGYAPAQRELPRIKKRGCYHAKHVISSRPWWHLCCNGDSGGWRTRLCDYLEHTWRDIEAQEDEAQRAKEEAQ